MPKKNELTIDETKENGVSEQKSDETKEINVSKEKSVRVLSIEEENKILEILSGLYTESNDLTPADILVKLLEERESLSQQVEQMSAIVEAKAKAGNQMSFEERFKQFSENQMNTAHDYIINTVSQKNLSAKSKFELIGSTLDKISIDV